VAQRMKQIASLTEQYIRANKFVDYDALDCMLTNPLPGQVGTAKKMVFLCGLTGSNLLI